MGRLIPPPRPAIIPLVEENYAAPDIYIDGAIFSFTPGIAHITCYTERRRGEIVAYCEAARVHLPMEGMLASMLRAKDAFMGPKGGH